MRAAVPPITLQIRFAAGERPHFFWVSKWERGLREATRYKVLTKRMLDSSVEVLVVQEGATGTRRRLARETIPASRPAGWLTRWVGELEENLGTSFSCFDLRFVSSRDEWKDVVRRLGWVSEPELGALD